MGKFNFNATPLDPLGTKVLVHLKPEQRTSFVAHGIDAWYVRPSLNYYRCYNCWMPETSGTRDTYNVDLFPH